jgi:hypothetical protein
MGTFFKAKKVIQVSHEHLQAESVAKKASKVRVIQKSSTISVFGRKLHSQILLTSLIPNITFLFEFEQLLGEKFSNTESTEKSNNLHHSEKT